MKYISILLLGFLVPFSFARPKNTIKFINNCPYDIWFWTVGPKDSNIDCSDESRTRVPGNHGRAVHGMFATAQLSAGIALKIRDVPNYQKKPAGIVQVEYTVEADKSVWYDLSVIDCNPDIGPEDPSYCPLVTGGVNLYIPGADDKHCPPASCSNGSCQNAYQRPGPFFREPSLDCRQGVEIIIETCTECIGPRTFQTDSLPIFPSLPVMNNITIPGSNNTKSTNGTQTTTNTQTTGDSQPTDDSQKAGNPEKKLQTSSDAHCGEKAGVTWYIILPQTQSGALN